MPVKNSGRAPTAKKGVTFASSCFRPKSKLATETTLHVTEDFDQATDGFRYYSPDPKFVIERAAVVTEGAGEAKGERTCASSRCRSKPKLARQRSAIVTEQIDEGTGGAPKPKKGVTFASSWECPDSLLGQSVLVRRTTDEDRHSSLKPNSAVWPKPATSSAARPNTVVFDSKAASYRPAGLRQPSPEATQDRLGIKTVERLTSKYAKSIRYDASVVIGREHPSARLASPEDGSLEQGFLQIYQDFKVVAQIAQEGICQTCVGMTAGPNVKFQWSDTSTGTPVHLSAIEYMQELEFFICVQLVQDNLFFQPMKNSDRHSPKLLNVILRRIFRVYAHIYMEHVGLLRKKGLLQQVGSFFKFYLAYVAEFGVVAVADLQPAGLLCEVLNQQEMGEQLADEAPRRDTVDAPSSPDDVSFFLV